MEAIQLLQVRVTEMEYPLIKIRNDSNEESLEVCEGCSGLIDYGDSELELPYRQEIKVVILIIDREKTDKLEELGRLKIVIMSSLSKRG